MWIVIVLLALWYFSRPTAVLPQATQSFPVPGVASQLGVLRASGLSVMGDHATEISNPGLAREPSSDNGTTTAAGAPDSPYKQARSQLLPGVK